MSGDLSSSLRQLASPLIHPAPFVRVSANMRKRSTCVLVAGLIKDLGSRSGFSNDLGSGSTSTRPLVLFFFIIE